MQENICISCLNKARKQRCWWTVPRGKHEWYRVPHIRKRCYVPQLPVVFGQRFQDIQTKFRRIHWAALVQE